ncbi:ABC transporter permease [Butyrivibrio sp. VCD2006]|uniref:ABC transporter permease n=1 Tax=Butyrivibrio sp. VCD2006 TaxID=1280664 RepID=UPI00047DA3A7|nr:ABC transporter permease [Butyrivibrio sp. VCD2006]
MSGFIRRCVGVVLVLFGVMVMIFVVLRIIPGNPAAVLLNEHVNSATIERLTASMNLDKPLPEQFFMYLAGVLRGDLGQSYYMRQSVLSLVLEAFPYTLKLTILSAVFAWVLGIGIGVISALHHDRLPDYLFRGVSLLGVSVPVFMVALFLQYLFYFRFSLLPLVYDGSFESMILPAIALGWNSAGSVARLTRSSLMEQFGQPYLDTARAKGLTARQAVLTHGLKNSMVPVITMIAMQFSGMLSGAVITESVFGIAGLGKLALTAVQTRDMPLLQGTVLFSALVISLGNIIADLINVCLDPRLRV